MAVKKHISGRDLLNAERIARQEFATQLLWLESRSSEVRQRLRDGNTDIQPVPNLPSSQETILSFVMAARAHHARQAAEAEVARRESLTVTLRGTVGRWTAELEEQCARLALLKLAEVHIQAAARLEQEAKAVRRGRPKITKERPRDPPGKAGRPSKMRNLPPAAAFSLAERIKERFGDETDAEAARRMASVIVKGSGRTPSRAVTSWEEDIAENLRKSISAGRKRLVGKDA